MKLVKKILRLLPLIILIYAMLVPLLSRLPFDNTYTFELLVGFFSGGYFEEVYNEFFNIIADTPFQILYDWVAENISYSVFVLISFSTLCYELFLSLCFLIFDFINLVFGWANKLIDRGANSVE